MNCPTARQILDLACPDDARTQTVDEAVRHVDGCAACQAVVRRHEAFDKTLGAMVYDVPVPAGLKERLLDDLAVAAQYENGGGIAAAQVLAGSSVSTKVSGRSRRRWLGAVSLAAACVVVGWGAWSLFPRAPQYDLDIVVSQVTDNALNPADLPAFTEFAGGLVPVVPATMMTGRLGLPARRLGDSDVAVYFFTLPIRRGPSLVGRLVVIPKRFVKGNQIPAATRFLAGTAYKAGFCTTSWVEGDFVYVCCLSGGEAGMKTLLPSHSPPI